MSVSVYVCVCVCMCVCVHLKKCAMDTTSDEGKFARFCLKVGGLLCVCLCLCMCVCVCVYVCVCPSEEMCHGHHLR